MARNQETYQLDSLLQELDNQVCVMEETKSLQVEAHRLSITLRYIRKLRDTLISIAQCQGDLSSHQAQDVLKELGYCYHVNQTYVAESGPNECGGVWNCADCPKTGPERLVPYR